MCTWTLHFNKVCNVNCLLYWFINTCLPSNDTRARNYSLKLTWSVYTNLRNFETQSDITNVCKYYFIYKWQDCCNEAYIKPTSNLIFQPWGLFIFVFGASTILVKLCVYSTQSRALSSQTLSLSNVVLGLIFAENVQCPTVIWDTNCVSCAVIHLQNVLSNVV